MMCSASLQELLSGATLSTPSCGELRPGALSSQAMENSPSSPAGTSQSNVQRNRVLHRVTVRDVLAIHGTMPIGSSLIG